MQTRTRWRWLEGEVDPADAHFVLRWPAGRWPGYREQSDVARVGRAPAAPDAFLVDWLRPAELAPHHLLEAHADALAEVHSYLVHRADDDPWAHAREHCASAANLHSCVRWVHVAPGVRAAPSRARARPRSAPPALRSIPVTCPRCATPTRFADSRCFACPACAWHD